MIISLLSFSFITNYVYGECGWFTLDAGLEKAAIYGFGYCSSYTTLLESGEIDEESYLFDCINNRRIQYFFDGLKCAGDPFKNDTDPTNDYWKCDEENGYCNCVSAEESECEYLEFKVYDSSNCNDEVWEKTGYVLNQCYITGDSKSQKNDCEPATVLQAQYGNTDCSGSSSFDDVTSFSEDPCIKYTCKGSANYIKHFTILPIILSFILSICW